MNCHTNLRRFVVRSVNSGAKKFKVQILVDHEDSRSNAITNCCVVDGLCHLSVFYKYHFCCGCHIREARVINVDAAVVLLE